MIDREILRLVERDAQLDLSELERDIWVLERSKHATRRLVSWQAVVMVVAIAGSATVGSSLGLHSPRPQVLGALSGVESLAPSSLLLGVHL